MMRPPLIAVTTSVTIGKKPERVYLNASYVNAVQQAGAVPVPIPPQLDRATRAELWERLDGVVLTGGGDINPARFSEPAHPTVSDVSDSRDDLETDLVHWCLEHGRPLFAICRGIQVLNVALGGSLCQDIADEIDTHIVHDQKEPRSRPTHEVRIAADSRLHAISRALELSVNSFHHQAIKRLGHGLREVAWAPDGVIEGVEMDDGNRFVIGVQWHPEELVDHDIAARNLFASLVHAAAALT